MSWQRSLGVLAPSFLKPFQSAIRLLSVLLGALTLWGCPLETAPQTSGPGTADTATEQGGVSHASEASRDKPSTLHVIATRTTPALGASATSICIDHIVIHHETAPKTTVSLTKAFDVVALEAKLLELASVPMAPGRITSVAIAGCEAGSTATFHGKTYAVAFGRGQPVLHIETTPQLLVLPGQASSLIIDFGLGQIHDNGRRGASSGLGRDREPPGKCKCRPRGADTSKHDVDCLDESHPTCFEVSASLVDNSPLVSIVSPQSGAYTSAAPLVAGLAASSVPLTGVVVNAMTAALTNIEWQVTPSLAEGPATLSATASDILGRQATASIQVIVDATGPVLEIRAPAAGRASSANVIDIAVVDSGSGVDPASLNVMLDGEPIIASLAMDGKLTGTFSAPSGNHRLEVVARDRVGNPSYIARDFVYDANPPVPKLRVSGTLVSCGSTATVRVESARVELSLTVEDTVAGPDLSSVRVVLDGHVFWDGVSSVPVNAVANIAPGAHALVVDALDLAQNSVRCAASLIYDPSDKSLSHVRDLVDRESTEPIDFMWGQDLDTLLWLGAHIPGTGDSDIASADRFIDSHSYLFGVTSPDELRPSGAVADDLGTTRRYQQFYQGIPILGSYTRVHVYHNAVVFVANHSLQSKGIPVSPALSSARAEKLALADAGEPNAVLAGTTLAIYDQQLMQPSGPARTTLVWNVALRSSQYRAVAIDAGSGEVIWRDLALRANRQVFEHPKLCWLFPEFCLEAPELLFEEVPPRTSADVDARACFDHMGTTLTAYKSRWGRDGWCPDVAGGAGNITAFIHSRYDGAARFNAFFDGSKMVFSAAGVDRDGIVMGDAGSALDVVAHEFTHGVTQCTSDLVYERESGALNESFSERVEKALALRQR